MAADRLMRILALLATPGSSEIQRLCEVAVEITGLSGAGITVMVDGRPEASVCSSNPVAGLVEELQHTLGEGPCIDAHRLGEAVAEPDLAAARSARWPAFSPAALDAGVAAVFGYPVRIGAVRLGALDLYRDRPGPLSDDQHADALVIADVSARTVLAGQADAPPGELGADLDTRVEQWLVVQQAAGMVSVQLATSVGEALVRLRAHAFATDRRLTEVAQDVVERRLYLDGTT